VPKSVAVARAVDVHSSEHGKHLNHGAHEEHEGKSKNPKPISGQGLSQPHDSGFRSEPS